MSLICTKCRKLITNKQSLTCNLCKDNYHLDCTNISFQRFRIMTRENKRAFNCCSCESKLKFSTPNTKGSIASPANSSTRDIDNITQRNKQKVIPVDYSLEESLSDEADFASQGSPMQSQTNRSFSELQPTGTYLIEDLKDKIRTLKERLEIAENEIENLLTLNNDLTKLNNKYELRINQLSLICKSSASSPKINTNIKKNKANRIINMNLSTAQPENEENNDQNRKDSDLNRESTPSPLKPEHRQSILQSHSDLNPTAPTEVASDISNNNTKQTKDKRIFIIGDEQLRGLAATIAKTRSGKWNDVYKPFALIMSGATSTEILEKCNSVLPGLNSNDVVILGCGSHDKDIQKLHSNICIAVNVLCKAFVLIAPVNSNPYLNEKMINYNLKLWTRHFVNCEVFDMSVLFNNRRNNSDNNYITNLCSKINTWVDYRQYEKQFLSTNSIKKRIKMYSTQSQKKNNDINSIPKKGKITFYFKPTKKNSTTPMVQDNSEDNNMKLCNHNNKEQKTGQTKEIFFR